MSSNPSQSPKKAVRSRPSTSRRATFGSESLGPRGESALAKRSEAALVDPNSKVALLAQVPAEEVWLASLRSERTRKAYRQDVSEFVGALDIASREELYAVTPAAVLAASPIHSDGGVIGPYGF